MAQTELSIIIQARDMATGQLQKVSQEFQALQNTLKMVKVDELNASMQAVGKTIDNVAPQVDGLDGAVKKTAGSMGHMHGKAKGLAGEIQNLGMMFRMAGEMMLVMAAISLPTMIGAKAVTIAVDYQDAMNLLQATTQSTGSEMEALGRKAKELGADLELPKTSAGQAGQAMLELAKGGLSVKDVMTAAKGTIQLATAAQIDEAEAAEIQANALMAFGLAGTEANRVADLLAASANTTTAEITDMAYALRMSSAVFAAAGVPIEDLTAAIGEMANAGIKNSDAGTSLKQMLLALYTPSKEAARLMRQMGINMYDAQGKMVPLRELIRQFSEGTKSLTQQQRDHALATIFGSDAVRAANIVMAAGVDKFDAMKEAVMRQGAAADITAARTKGLRGAWQAFGSQVETVMLEAVEPLMGGLEGLVRTLAGAVIPAFESTRKALGFMAEHKEELLASLGAIAAYILVPLIPAFLAWAGAAIAAAGASIAALAPVLLPIIAIGAAAALLVYAWKSNWGDIQGKTQAVWNVIKPIFEAVGDWLGVQIAKAGRDLSRLWTNTLKPALETVWRFVQGSVIPILTTLGSVALKGVQTYLEALAWAWKNVLSPALNALWSFIENYVGPILRDLADLWLAAVGLGFSAIAAVWRLTLGPAFDAIWAFVKDNIGPAFQTFADANIAAVKGAFNGIVWVWDNALKPALTTLWNFIKDDIGPALEKLGGLTLKAIKTSFEGVRDAIKWVIEKLQDLKGLLDGLSFDNLKLPSIPGLAHGTAFFGGGLALVGERGPEVVALPRGARVFSNPESRNMFVGGGNIDYDRLASAIVRATGQRVGVQIDKVEVNDNTAARLLLMGLDNYALLKSLAGV